MINSFRKREFHSSSYEALFDCEILDVDCEFIDNFSDIPVDHFLVFDLFNESHDFNLYEKTLNCIKK
jgi:hypothetical protein